MTEWIAAGDLPTMLRPGMTVFVAGGPVEPLTLIEALQAAPDASAGVHYVCIVVPGLNHTDLAALHPDTRVTVFFMTPALRTSATAGRVDCIPLHLRGIYDFLAHELTFDLALFQTAAPPADGHFSLGLSADFVPAVLPCTTTVVAEVNRAMPIPPGAPTLAASRVDYAVDCHRPVTSYPLAEPTPDAQQIGRQVAALIKDGDCIQTGIGAVPYATLFALRDRNDLGLHSGLVDDGVMALAQAGVLTGKTKTIDRGKMITGFALGTPALYEWAGQTPDLVYKPVSYTHDATVLCQLDNFVSINSALQVDLFGQVNAEMLRGRQIAGTGGSVNFMRGASRSPGGRSIIALTATAAGGTISRIVPALDPQNAVTALRTDIEYVITEYGTRSTHSQTWRWRFVKAAVVESLAEGIDPQ